MGTNVSLTKELEEYVKSKVDEGLYGSVSEVMRDALRQMKIREREYAAYVRAELAKAELSIAEHGVFDFDMDEIMAEVDAEEASSS